jgi:glycosyltransferase involved in cell wall biosynthesis
VGSAKPESLLVSVVVPMFNEEESVRPLYERLRPIMDAGPWAFEVVFVDDGSADRTFDEIRRLHETDPRIRCVRFRRNYGQTPAMKAGFDHARGDVVVSMDGDLQNDPADIPRFLEKIDEGYGVVCGWRKDRKDKAITRKLPSKIANRLIRSMTGVTIHDTGCSLKAYRADVIQSAPLYAEMHRFIPAVTSMSGARVAEIVVTHHARKFGQSKYGLGRIWRVLSDLLVIKTLTGFSKRPSLWFGLLSLPFLALAVAGFAASAIVYERSRPGDPLPLVYPGATLLFGFAFMSFLTLGLLTELVVATGRFHESEVLVTEVVG